MASLRTAAVAVLALVFLAASAQAQNETLQVSAHDDGGAFYFLVEGLDGRNPTITLEPGTEVTIEFTNEGPSQSHNLRLGDPIDEGTELIEPGASRTLQFTVPAGASGDAEYWCDPHRPLDMAGDVEFAGNGNGGNGNDEEPGNGAPGPAFFLVLIALAAAAAGRRS